MKALPRRPGPRAGLFDLIDYLVAMAEFLGDSAVALIHGQGQIMATVEELQAALDANSAATTAAGAAIQSEITDLAAAVAALTPGQPVTQAQIDQLNASTTALQTATASLQADDPNASAGV